MFHLKEQGEVTYSKFLEMKVIYEYFLDKINNDLAPDCNDSSVTNLFDFRIRSITFNKDEQEFPSNWSPIEVVPAYCEESVPFLIIGIVVGISVIIAFIFTIYFCRCCKWGH